MSTISVWWGAIWWTLTKYLTLLGALVVTNAMLRHLTNWRVIIIIIKGNHGVICRWNCVIHAWAPWVSGTTIKALYKSPYLPTNLVITSHRKHAVACRPMQVHIHQLGKQKSRQVSSSGIVMKSWRHACQSGKRLGHRFEVLRFSLTVLSLC